MSILGLLSKFQAWYGARPTRRSPGDLQDYFGTAWRDWFANLLVSDDDRAAEPPAAVVEELRSIGKPFSVLPQALEVIEEDASKLGLDRTYLDALRAEAAVALHRVLQAWVDRQCPEVTPCLQTHPPSQLIGQLVDSLLEDAPGLIHLVRDGPLCRDVFSWPAEPVHWDGEIRDYLVAAEATRQGRLRTSLDPDGGLGIAPEDLIPITDSFQWLLRRASCREAAARGIHILLVVQDAALRRRGHVSRLTVSGVYLGPGKGRITLIAPAVTEAARDAVERAYQAAFAYVSARHPTQAYRLGCDHLFVDVQDLPTVIDGPSICLPVALATIDWALRPPSGDRTEAPALAATGDLQWLDGAWSTVAVESVAKKTEAAVLWNRANATAPIRRLVVPGGDNETEARGVVQQDEADKLARRRLRRRQLRARDDLRIEIVGLAHLDDWTDPPTPPFTPPGKPPRWTVARRRALALVAALAAAGTMALAGLWWAATTPGAGGSEPPAAPTPQVRVECADGAQADVDPRGVLTIGTRDAILIEVVPPPRRAFAARSGLLVNGVEISYAPRETGPDLLTFDFGAGGSGAPAPVVVAIVVVPNHSGVCR